MGCEKSVQTSIGLTTENLFRSDVGTVSSMGILPVLLWRVRCMNKVLKHGMGRSLSQRQEGAGTEIRPNTE